MSSQYSSTAVSSHSSTPGFLLSDEYLAADLSDVDEPDTLPALTHTPHSQHEADGVEEVDEDGVVKLAVDDETRAQLQEIQGVLAAQLDGRPHPSHFSTASASQRAAHDRPAAALTSTATSFRSLSHASRQDVHTADANHHAHTSATLSSSLTSPTSSSSSTSHSSLLALLASKDADLRLAAQLGAALSDKTETLEQYCRHLEQQLATLHSPTIQHDNPAPHSGAQQSVCIADAASVAHRTSHSLTSVADGSTAEEELARVRLELGRLERRMAVSESWHRDALKAARRERRETEERLREIERDGKRREADEADRRKRDDEDRIRLTEEVEQLRAMEQQRLVRERELRRQRELKEKEDEDEQRHSREETVQAEHRWRDEQRKRDEMERRCRTLEKQRDDAVERAILQAKEFEQRRRRWEHERGRAVDDEVERHRSQAKALADQYRAVEEQLKQSDKKRTLSVDTSGRLSPTPPSPPSGDEGRERRAVQVSHSTQTPGDWVERLDRAESAMTIPKGRSEVERVLYSPLHFTLLSPSTAEEAGKESREEKKEVAPVATVREGRADEDELVIPLSLVTPPRQATRPPYLSPQSPLPKVVELTDEDERALTDVVAQTVPAAPVATDNRDVALDAAASSQVSFLSPLYSPPLSASSANPVATARSAQSPVVPASQSPAPSQATPPPRRSIAAVNLSPFLTRPAFRSPQATSPPASSAAAFSPLFFTLHTSHPSSIRAQLTASPTSSPLPPLPPLSTPFAQLQSSLVKQGAGGRLQPCTDDATKRVFSLLMQTRMGEGVAGFG